MLSTEENRSCVPEGHRGDVSVAELGRRQYINANLYYHGSRDFLKPVLKRLSGDPTQENNTD